MVKVAFQGEIGAYSEQASKLFFGEKEVDLVPCESFRDVFEAVKAGNVEYAVLPIENSLAGSIHENYDLMHEYKLHVQGEQILRVSHNLIGKPGSTLEDISEVYSHPQALSQCSSFFKKHPGIEKKPYYDTAGSVKMIASRSENNMGAIAARQAADDYGLTVLAESIENESSNYTRFLVLSMKKLTDVEYNEGVRYKTSIVYSLQSIPGALFKSLSVFALRDINLMKVESRPLIGTPWEYLFYVDFVGHIREESTRKALDHLMEITSVFNVFGSYPCFKQD
jgi:prephenate dehydratase